MEAVKSTFGEHLQSDAAPQDYGFRDQLTRSGLSIPSNIAEGFERKGRADIARFLVYAKGSCGELITQVYIGIEAGYIERDQGMGWVKETKELASILGALIRKYSASSKD